MKQISDEMIMAYVDGELEEPRATSVRQAMETDPDLVRRAAVFSESADALRVFDAPLHEDIPEQLLATVHSAPAGSRYSRLARFFRQLSKNLVPHPVPALAAVLVLVLGGWFTYQGLRRPEYPAFIANQSFFHILETVPSGQEAAMDNGVSVMPVLTFVAKDKRFCRRFDLLRDGHAFAGGIGCRTGARRWKLLAYQNRDQQENSLSRQGYELAGSEDRLDRVMEEHRQGPILSIKEEQDLLQRR